ncbi:stage II sporulation protein E [Clostridium culturomicium]|uniref:stage II sporulation protein E n=1 Tax=Clostridium culturomicium TaxID=1499683 RepID=UPI003857DAC2
MQFGEEIKTYERIRSNMVATKDRKSQRVQLILEISTLFLTAMLISRVIMINKSAPFGIAFVLTMLLYGDSKLSLISGVGAIIGYTTINGHLSNTILYISVVATLVVIYLIVSNFLKKELHKPVMLTVTVIVVCGYVMLMSDNTAGIALGNAAIELVGIIPVYLILEYSLNNIRKIKTRHLFSNEEIVAMSTLVALVIAGTWNVEFFNISLTPILSVASVVIIGYICGVSIGSTAGVAMGVLVGMSNNNIFAYATLLGLCGLVSGIFREGGKVISAIASFIIFCIIKFYITTYMPIGIDNFILVEGVLATVIFLLIPNQIYEVVSNEMDIEKKNQVYEEGYINKVKNIFTERLDKFSEVLINMSSTLTNLADNDKLDMNTKSSGLVENLANRVCNTCDTCTICWGREMVNTYKAFEDLIENAQNGSSVFPVVLEKKCMKKGALIRNTEDVINKFVINEMWRSRLAEGRELIANQFNNMAKSVDEIMEEFSADFNEDKGVEKKLERIFEKYDIEVEDVFVIKDKFNRADIQIVSDSCNGRNLCVKKMLPLINECAEYPMKLRENGCRIDPITKKCTARFCEVPKFNIKTSVARACKDGQSIYGDNFDFGECIDGSYMMVLSDGMGSGPQAGRESKAVVDLIGNFTSAGFSRTTAINTVNSIMSLKFSEEEKFSTVDLSAINLYSGDVDFIKVGAVASIIQSGDTIDIVKSRSLPIGVLDEADIEIYNKKVKAGDLIVMLTDGVIDNDEENRGRVDWILDYLCRNNDLSPEEIAKGVVKLAKESGNNKVSDDMTVMVSKVYSA